MKLNYKQKIFIYFFIVFVLFTAGIVIFEQKREKNYKTEILESKQKTYVDLLHLYILQNNISLAEIDSLKKIISYFPSNLRVTFIDKRGRVLFDNDVDSSESMENHIDRPEIKKAGLKKYGSNIRRSTSLNKEFMYFAGFYDEYYIRVALPYDVGIKNFFKPDNVFLYFVVLLFFIALLAILLISNRFGKSIARLKDFINTAQNENNSDLSLIHFPDDELGSIGCKIVELYKQINDNKDKIAMEREKLLLHFQSSQEGICFFSPKKEKIYANSHFIQYLNMITDKPTLSVNSLFKDPNFESVVNFIETNRSGLSITKLSKTGKHFNIKAVKFDDMSFEISIEDITKMEKNRLLKQELTNNIAHDLRTPVTSVRGYLETLKSQPDIEISRRIFFIERAYSQIIRLSDLIQDISLITKMEEASELFERENIKILPLLIELQKDLSDILNDRMIQLDIKVSDGVSIDGNKTLLYSIFRNLMDNSILYGGTGIQIVIDNYMEDEEYYYFSFFDTGEGVEDKHLGRLFERFYRVSEGRSSNNGGSGLGLAIVKNAILYHKGEIIAKNRRGKGLEFLFTLKKLK